MLVVLAWVYISGGGRQFMVMYVTFIIISTLFDLIELLELPSLDTMTPGEKFGNVVWIVIFAFKPIVAGTMVLYDQLELNRDGGEGNQWTQFDVAGQPGVNYEDVPFDERVAA